MILCRFASPYMNKAGRDWPKPLPLKERRRLVMSLSTRVRSTSHIINNTKTAKKTAKRQFRCNSWFKPYHRQIHHRRGGGSGGWRRRVCGPAALKRQGGEKIVRNCGDWQLGEELIGEWRMAAVLGRNPRGRGGCRWPEAAVRVRGAVGRLGRSRGGVGGEWRWEDE
jgi:hypothetical protein